MRRIAGISWFAMLLLFFLAAVGYATTIHYRFSSAGEFPGAAETEPLADSVTQIVGYYTIEIGNFAYQNGYLQSPGIRTHPPFLSLQPPGGWFSYAAGINSHGVVVGGYCVPPQQCHYPQTTHGFSFSNGSFESLDYPGAQSTGAFGINDLGQIAGGYCLTVTVCGTTFVPTDHGFLDSNGTFTELDYPGAQATQASAINKAGAIVGIYEINNIAPHSFLYQNGKYMNIDFPGALTTTASAINNKGVVAGYYELQNAGVLGFTYSAGKFYTVQYPKTNDTALTGINDKGVIVGAYNPPIGLQLTFKGVPVK